MLKINNNISTVEVGILSSTKIHFILNSTYTIDNSKYNGEQEAIIEQGKILFNNKLYKEICLTPINPNGSFTIENVTIGINFHWERKEKQTFLGKIKLITNKHEIQFINIIDIEEYLKSVISSEMSSTASLELLKAHAVISRSWLLVQIKNRIFRKKTTDKNFDILSKEPKTNATNEICVWYNSHEHTLFDVCSDDHCQRYQGITKVLNKNVIEAVEKTKGQILTYDNKICDTRYSKCCGGVMEEYQYCWENIRKPYLVALPDNKNNISIPDLTNENIATKWITTTEDVFCNTKDEKILKQILNNYDQETQDFYQWTVTYSQAEISKLINEKLHIDFGYILDIIPLSRGKSGRIYRLKIIGSKYNIIIGKELEIRRVLSKSHLYSSAFIIIKNSLSKGIPNSFTITGKGWGHGVGLCQIGAAVMGEKGYNYKEILYHYYKGAIINSI